MNAHPMNPSRPLRLRWKRFAYAAFAFYLLKGAIWLAVMWFAFDS